LGLDDKAYGYQPRYMSADGKVIAGYLVPRMPRYVGCFWRVEQPDAVNFLKRDDPAFFASQFHEASGKYVPGKYIRAEKLSADGKTITATFEDFTVTEVGEKKPMSYDIETGLTVVADAAGTGAFTLPDGTIAYYGAASTCFYQKGASVSIDDWLLENHNFDLPVTNVFLRDVSASGKVMAGYRTEGAMIQPVLISL
jgi:hypothetical protein